MVERGYPTSVLELQMAVPETARFLPPIPRKFDLPPANPGSDPGSINGFAYEAACLDFLAERTPSDNLVIGPNYINQTLGRSTFGYRNSIPDAMVFKPGKHGLVLVELSEFKLRKFQSRKKIRGFGQLLKKIRKDPDRFNEVFKKPVAGLFDLPTISVGSNVEIEFTFASPKSYHSGFTMIHNSPCRVFYYTVPVAKS